MSDNESVTDRQKIAHLLRRFGLGATKSELDHLEPLGVQGALDWLIDYEKTEDDFKVSPWSFCFDEGSKEVYLDPYRTIAWWSLRFVMTRRPLQENLTMFWHNHFAVSAEKIEFGPAMLSYVDTLRDNASGNFATLLTTVSKEPAMIKWLDTDADIKGHANENFAREVCELFTMGIGHYTEKDVQEAARAFTGWGLRYLLYEPGADKIQQTARESMEKGTPMIAFCVTPSLHDGGPKTFLGQTGNFDGDDILNILAKRPETARYMSAKLWSWFAYPNPESTVVDRLAAKFEQCGGNTKAMLREIAKSPEFWGDKCVRRKVKSPIDFVVAITRQFELQPIIAQLAGPAKSPLAPAPKTYRDVSGLVYGSMLKQGLTLLYPPNVAGWHWGEAWISTANMLERMRFADLIFGVGQKDKPLAGFLAAKIKTEAKATTDAEIVAAILAVFDAEVTPDKLEILNRACTASGGIAALSNPEGASKLFGAVCHLLFASPDFQFC